MINKINNFFPFLIPLLCFILGIFWQSLYQINLLTLLATITLILFTLLHSIWQNLHPPFFLSFTANSRKNLSVMIEGCKKIKITPLILLFFLFSGAFLYQQQKESNIKILQNLKNQNLEIETKVKSIEFQENKFFKYVINLKSTNGYNLLCYSKQKPIFKVDDLISLKNIKIKQQKDKDNNSGRPTFYDYLLKENYLTTIFLNKEIIIEVLNSPSFSLKKWVNSKRINLYKTLKQKLTPLTFSYFSSIFLGNKNNKNMTDLKIKFNNWGIIHYLARSGLHIVIFILLWTFLLRFIPITIFYKILFLILISFIYHMFSWPSISYYRAFYLFLFIQTGQLLNLQTNFLHLLSLVCLTILLFNPIQLFFLDFQLSFGLTLALAWLNFSAFNKNTTYAKRKT
ncbi:MAG: ComEC/Rec2 family competence protein [bacterium]